MGRFFHATPIRKPEDVIPFLGKGAAHWKEGYSACELARSWVLAKDIPAPVRAVLGDCADYQDAELLEGLVEHKTDLPGHGAASQTDLLALIKTGVGHAVIAVEGKVEESFDKLVGEWNDGSPNKRERLTALCMVLGLDAASVHGLRYQLLHRAVAAVFEARRYQCAHALLLVHSFSAKHSWFGDFQAFAEALGCPTQIGKVSGSRLCNGVALRLAWVADRASPAHLV